MGFTYSLENLTEPVAQVRDRIGDTIKGQMMLHDEEIERIIAEQGLSSATTLSNKQANSVAYVACKRAIARLTRDIDRSNLGMSATRSQKIENLTKVCDQLERDLALSGARPLATGTSIARKDELRADTDFIGAKVTRDRDANPGASTSQFEEHD